QAGAQTGAGAGHRQGQRHRGLADPTLAGDQQDPRVEQVGDVHAGAPIDACCSRTPPIVPPAGAAIRAAPAVSLARRGRPPRHATIEPMTARPSAAQRPSLRRVLSAAAPRRLGVVLLLAACLLGLVAPGAAAQRADGATVEIVEISGLLDRTLADYLSDALSGAAERGS